MAVLIIMLKDYEDENRVVYCYGPNEETLGKIEYDKINNVIPPLSPIDSDRYPDNFFFRRAGTRLARMAMRENNSFVERTTIES